MPRRLKCCIRSCIKNCFLIGSSATFIKRRKGNVQIQTIDAKWINEKSACEEAVILFAEHYKDTVIAGDLLVEVLIKEKRLQWANWLLPRIMNKIQCVKYAVFAAEQVIDIFEKKCPDDKRPREAIEAAKRWLGDPSDKNKAAAAADAAAAALRIKILKYGLEILREEK